MKKIGIIGGLSHQSTEEYCILLHNAVSERFGGHNNARLLVEYVNFQDFVELKQKDDWATQEKLLIESAQNLERGKADFIILATNTMHKMAAAIAASVNIPFLHIADATADQIIKAGVQKVGLLGTKFTMLEDFYKQRLIDRGIEVLIPSEDEVKRVNDIIYDELCHHIIQDQSRDDYKRIIDGFSSQGAGGVILGCTEIGLLLGEQDTELKVFDTTKIHVQAAFEYSVG